MEHVSAEMNHFFESCEILLHEMSPQDFSDKECNLIEHYCLELYVRYGSRGANSGRKVSHRSRRSRPPQHGLVALGIARQPLEDLLHLGSQNVIASLLVPFAAPSQRYAPVGSENYL